MQIEKVFGMLQQQNKKVEFLVEEKILDLKKIFEKVPKVYISKNLFSNMKPHFHLHLNAHGFLAIY